MDHVFIDCIKGQLKELKRNANFPALEANYQFDFAIKHAMTASYKASFDALRSTLEMATLSVYFAMEKHVVDEIDWFTLPPEDIAAAFEKDAKWFKSEAITPFYSRMLKTLASHPRFADFDTKHQWFDKLKEFYHTLSDYTHIKGYRMGTQHLNNVNIHIRSSCAVNVNLTSFDLFIDFLIEMVGHIGVMFSLYNPVLLAELPILEKFGMNEPIGFVYNGQSSMANQIIPNLYKDYFKQLLQTDEEVIGVTKWVNSMPDLTNEDLDRQADLLNRMLEDFNKMNA